jgi:hypothetical protein
MSAAMTFDSVLENSQVCGGDAGRFQLCLNNKNHTKSTFASHSGGLQRTHCRRAQSMSHEDRR